MVNKEEREQNGAAQREARVKTKRTFLNKEFYSLFIFLGDGDGKEVWGGKTEVYPKDQVLSATYFCELKSHFSSDQIFNWASLRRELTFEMMEKVEMKENWKRQKTLRRSIGQMWIGMSSRGRTG